jgi:hypothetical protein
MTKDTDQKTGQEPKEFYVYTWFRPDKNEVFYVGKGKGSRSSNTYRRNAHFKNILNKLSELGMAPTVVRVADGLTESEAFKIEIELISKYRRAEDGGTLCNITTGGDGASGVVKSIESRRRTSESVKIALSNPVIREKISDRGYKRYENPEARILHGIMVSKRYEDPAEREKMATPLRGVPKSADHVRNVSLALTKSWDGNAERKEAHRAKTLKRPPHKGNKSGYKGVSFDKSTEKWLAQIEVEGRNKHLGRHLTPEEAARAYDRGAVRYYGFDVYLNFPGDHIQANDNAPSTLVCAHNACLRLTNL